MVSGGPVRQRKQLRYGEWVYPTLREVEANAVLVRGLPPFHDEGMVLHLQILPA